MKKLTKIGLGIVILFLLVVVLGGSSNNNKAPAQPATQEQKTVETEAVTPVITPEPTPEQTQTVYQDFAWSRHVLKYSPLIGTDFTNAGAATNDLNFDSLATNGQNIVADTQKALDENSKLNVSPKLQEAQDEWSSALQDYNLAGKNMIQIANDGKAGRTDTDKIQNVTSLCNSGTGHMNRASALLKAATI